MLQVASISSTLPRKRRRTSRLINFNPSLLFSFFCFLYELTFAMPGLRRVAEEEEMTPKKHLKLNQLEKDKTKLLNDR